MITALLQTTDAVIGASLPVTTRHIIASLQEGQPVVHTGGGNFAPIANDLNGLWSYQRIRSEISVIATTLAGDPCRALQASVPLRIVALLSRDGCDDIATGLAAALRASKQQAETATGAFSVEFDRVAWTFDTNKGQEFSGNVTIPLTKTLLVMDVQITVRGQASCLVACEPVDVTCAIIAEATIAKIRECLGDRLAAVCDTEPCPPTTVNGVESDTPTITVLQGGNEVGTLNPATGVHTVPECEECEDATPTWDGEPWISIPAGTSPDINCDTLIPAAYVQDGGSRTGTYKVDGTVNGKTRYRLDANHTLQYSGTRWQCVDPGPDEQAAIGNEDEPWDADWSGTALTVTQATIASYCDDCPPCEPELQLRLNGGRVYRTLELECGIQDYDNVVTYPDGTPVGEWNSVEDRIEVPACDPCPLGYTLQDTAENPILSGIVNDPCENPTLTLTAPNATVQLRDSAANTIGSPVAYLSNSSNNLTAPDGSVQLRDSAGNVIGSPVAVRSNQTGLTVTAPDGTITVNSAAFDNVRSNGSLNVVIKDGTGTQVGSLVGGEWIVPTRPPDGTPIIYTLGRILHSGQETVYQAGDEGTMFASGQFNYNPAIGPNSVFQRLGADFVTLLNNNMFGNTLRFTNRTGGAAANSGNRFIMDHYTGYEWYVLGTLLTAANWAAAVTAGVTLNTTLGETGWFLPNDRLLDSITNDNSAAFISANPFAVGGTDPLWTSSTTPGATANAKFLGLTQGQLGATAKTTNTYRHGLYCRRFAP